MAEYEIKNGRVMDGQEKREKCKAEQIQADRYIY